MEGQAVPPSATPRNASADRAGRTERRRAEIVESAARLFDHAGYHGTSLDDVAGAVGLRKATLYHYFRSKDEILATIHEDFIAWVVEREERRALQGLHPEQHLLESIEDMMEIISRRPGHIRVFVEHHRDLDEPARRAAAEKRAHYTALIHRVVDAGMRNGAFREMDSSLAVLALFGACNWAYQWLPRDESVEPGRVAYEMWDVLMRGIQASS